MGESEFSRKKHSENIWRGWFCEKFLSILCHFIKKSVDAKESRMNTASCVSLQNIAKSFLHNAETLVNSIYNIFWQDVTKKSGWCMTIIVTNCDHHNDDHYHDYDHDDHVKKAANSPSLGPAPVGKWLNIPDTSICCSTLHCGEHWGWIIMMAVGSQAATCFLSPYYYYYHTSI